MYQSIYIPTVARICRERIERSRLKPKGTDYEEAAKYITLTNTEEEIRWKGISRVIPDR